MAYFLARSPSKLTRLRALGLASGLSLAAALACSGETVERGQIMLVLQTDMSLPKDVSKIRIQVLQSGAVKFDKTYNVGGPNDEKIPATLGVVGREEGETVEVRVIGFRGSEARTLNKVITTIPTERVAMLRMPIQWLCDGEVETFDEDTFETTCAPIDGEEAACVAGTCTKVRVEERELPSYVPEEVFGGGNGQKGAGSCFPTEECIGAQGFDVPPEAIDMASCTVNVPAGPEEPLNFAVKTGPGGDGICSGDSETEDCFVPLDQNDDFGWRENTKTAGGATPDEPVDGGVGAPAGMRRADLPKAVCDRIADGRATGVRASRTCNTKTAATPTCGPWSSVGNPGGPGQDGGGVPINGACPEFIPGADIGAVTGDPAVDAYLQAAADLKSRAEQLKGRAGMACGNIIATLGSTITLGNPPTDQEITDACSTAGTMLEAENAGAIPVAVAPGRCDAATAEQLTCEAECADQGGCSETLAFEERCSSLSGTCDGACYGDCVPGANGSEVQCSGTCSGTCVGACSGACSNGSPETCNGVCDGTCLGTCDGACTTSGTTCDGTCSGYDLSSCEGTFTALSCASPLTVEACAEDSCVTLCAATAGTDAVCSLTQTSVDPMTAAAFGVVAQAVGMNSAPLHDVSIEGMTLIEGASYLSAATGSLVMNLPPTSKEVACIGAAAAVFSEAVNTISNAVIAAEGVLAGIGTGGSGVGTPDGGTNYGCSLGLGNNALIDDFDVNSDKSLPLNDARSGVWELVSDGTAIVELFDLGAGETGNGLHITGGGFGGWGAGFGTGLSTTCYDASAYAGLSFWLQATDAAQLEVRIVTMDLLSTGCTAESGPTCAYVVSLGASSTWTQTELLWNDFADIDGDVTPPPFDPNNIVRIEFVQHASSVQFALDDLRFVLP